MRLEIKHTTSYSYGHPAAEAYVEARLTPRDMPPQRVISHSIQLAPSAPTSAYIDAFGNVVHFFSLPYRHRRLVVTNKLVVETRTPERTQPGLQLRVGEARQIFSSAMTDVFLYLQPTDIVQLGKEAVPWSRKYFRSDVPLGEGVEALNEMIHKSFEYQKGATDNSTRLGELWRTKRGVCQDFAHIGLSILRTAGLPARYVCGYIESDPAGSGERGLTGAFATHAWIEVLIPGMEWIAFDPTNKKWCDEQYVAVSVGRDFRDATPLRGTFKGAGAQSMNVKVIVKRGART